ncbi:hypothetical protein HIM_00034 [Hirsutella minnesotensis 3608]|nr:hypothetical protein HIM_00034 [Hirsutella minnesotensis 3608]
MLFKHLIVTALFSLGSVMANPEASPEAADVQLDARDVEGAGVEGELFARNGYGHGHGHDCGWGSYWDQWKKACVCKDRGHKYNHHSRKCESWCGHDAYSHHGRCVCRKEGMKFDHHNKKCYCPDGQSWNGRKCEHDCGRDAFFNYKHGKCVCHKRDMVYNKWAKKCECPRGEHWNGRSCEKACGRDASYSHKHGKCVCHNHHLQYNSWARKCECPKGEKYDHHSGKCRRSYGHY